MDKTAEKKRLWVLISGVVLMVPLAVQGDALSSKYLSLLGPKMLRTFFEEYERGESASQSPCEGRLTLTSGTGVTTADVTAATTVYFTPHHGNKIALYTGTVWQLISFSEVSVAVPSTTTTPFDIFGYNNSGTLTLETVDWTDDNTRATNLTLQNGIYVKSGAATRRYLGTGRTTSVSGQTEDSKAKRFLWNYANRAKRPLLVMEATGSWTYGTASWHPTRGSTANRVEVVVGIADATINLKLMGSGTADAGQEVTMGIGTDSTTAYDTNIRGMYGFAEGAPPGVISIAASLDTIPSAGYHFYQWLENSPLGGTVIYYGTTWGTSGLSGVIDG